MSDFVKELPEVYQKDIKKALEIFKEYGVTDVYLFGSLAKGTYNKNSDIDFAVKGLKDKYFFEVGGKLMMFLSNEFDLVETFL